MLTLEIKSKSTHKQSQTNRKKKNDKNNERDGIQDVKKQKTLGFVLNITQQ